MSESYWFFSAVRQKSLHTFLTEPHKQETALMFHGFAKDASLAFPISDIIKHYEQTMHGSIAILSFQRLSFDEFDAMTHGRAIVSQDTDTGETIFSDSEGNIGSAQ